MEWITAKNSTQILAVSNSLKDEYCRLGLSDIEKIEVLGLGSSHGVDVDYFHPTRWSGWEPPELTLKRAKSGEMPILGFVGRFSKDKGAEELLQCCQVLLEARIKHAIVIIGPLEGDEEALSELRRVNRHTVVTGAVKDVAPYYSVMDLLLLPTHREGFPNAVLEAAASGVPTVTTTATGAIDSVIDSQTGMSVPAHDGYALAAAVMELLRDPQLIQSMALNARSWVVSHFDSDRVSKNHSVYLTKMVRSKIVPE
jgi:glycosyltransferase involved in cell wall biosynthesis